MLLQRQQLLEQRDAAEQQAQAYQLAYQQYRHHQLSSWRSRAGFRQQESLQQQETRQCRCSPCGREQLSEAFIDIRDRFKHTQLEVHGGVNAMLQRIDTAAASLSDTFEEAQRLPWKQLLDDKLSDLQQPTF
ncbi:hypothetical protein cyc_04456 [Cyclospora cayetanensis]|uniref:Uncharacterized protein n=1 Tax=Cyclospora cayetanensis TaxID=88456 RepID=A0A1D3D8H7_9EIME|nr:hypothetical protein cyc_04456 [Cyclospora cayetanensis]